MIRHPLLNSATQSGQKTFWGHLTGLGEVPVTIETADGQKMDIVQVYDEAALDALYNRFLQDREAAGDRWAGLLVDFDHESNDADKSSQAGGWILNMERRGNELWGEIDPSDIGRAAIEGKRFRFLSVTHNPGDVAFLGNKRLRPLRIDRVALTNDPNNRRLKPIPVSFFNRAGAGASPEGNEHPAEAGKAGETKMDKKVLCNRLGLPETATDEEVAAKLDQVIANAKKYDEEMPVMKNRVTQLEVELVDADLATYGDQVEDKAALKTSLLKNRADTIQVLKVLKPRAATGPDRFRVTRRG